MSQRRTKMDRSNFFYKLLYERNTLGTMPVSIYNSAKNNRYLLQRLSLERELNVHSGCVNTICWNSTGQYLLSGSDDLHLCITDAFTGELRSKIRTGHVTNIFSAKYLPNTNDSQVISCSGDGVIIYTDLNRPESSHKNIFDCQEESVYDIATVPNDSHTFLTCSHDRTVRWYDLRVKTSCLKHPSYSRFARRSLQHKCNDDVLIRCDYPVTAIAVNSLMPWQLSIGCSDSIIRIYDRRMLTTTSLGGYLGDQDQSVLAKFTYNGLKNPNRITSLAYSRNCQQILASYSNDHLYLFDINDVKKTIEFGLERDIIPDKSQKQSCSFKRFRLRGDWSDTGPNAMTTNELRSTVSASVAAATAAAAAAAAIADTPLATTTNNTSTTGTSVPASSSSPMASFSASVANNSSSSSSFYAAQPQSSQITTTAAQSSSDLTESAAAQRAITTTTTNTTTTTTDSAEPNNRSSAARLRNLNTILSLILRSSFSRRSGGEEGAAADASSSTDAAPSSDEQEQPNDVVPMLLDDLEPSTVSEHLTNNDSVSLPSIASMSGADSDYSRPYPHHHHHHHHQHSHLNATSSQPASPLPLTSPLANASTTSAATFRTNPFSSLPQPQPPSLSTLAQRYQLDDFLLDSARALRTTSTTAPATTPSATSPLATTASPTPVSINSRSSSSPPDTVTTPSNNASRYFLQFFDPAPFPNFLNRFDDEEDDDDEEGVPELGARWPPAESSVTSNRTNDGSSSNNNNNNNDSTMATNASTPNTTTTTTTTSNNLEDNQSYNNIRHSHYIADLGDDIDSDTTNDSVFNHAGSDSLQAPVPIVRNLVTGRQRSRSSSSNDSPRNFLYHHQLPSSIPNSASSLASGLYPSSTNNNNNNDSSSSNPTLNRASERRNLRNINRTRLRNPTTAQATQQRLNRLRDSLGGGGGARNFDELSFMDDEDEDQESDIMHNSYYHSPYLHHPDSYHHFINQSYQPPTSTNSSSTNHLNNRGTSQTPPSSSSSQAKRLKTYKIRDYKTFVGHRNSRTVIKEATFWGDDYIVSGSDCGHIFFWSIKTCELVMIMEGDLHVVNCLQPHPTDPILASSGIDYNIKLWSPMSEENQFDENRAKTIISRNERMLEENRDTVTVPARFVLSLFSSIRNRQHPVRSQPFSVPQSGVNNNNNNNNHHHHHDSGSSVAASPNLVDSFSPWMRESNAVPSTGSGMQPDVTPDGTSVGPRNVEVEDDEEGEEEEEAWLPTSGDILVAVEDELDDEFEEDELMPANDDHDDDDEDDADIERIPL